ncbi:MAG: lytic transglycosylase domain-containing protein [Nitrospirota bacterium]|nr:lytic transglycosylase domain-containing protein [Nitrospirota bacterium]
MISHTRSPIHYSRSRRIITGFLISVTIGLLIITPATSADLHNTKAPDAADLQPAVTNSSPSVSDAEKTGSMEELLPASGEELDSGPGNDTPLVVVPPIERPTQRYFLSSFKLPAHLSFAGVSVPMDNWQVRERIEYEFYQFLAEEGESIIMAKRTGRCFPPVEKQLAQSGLPDDLKYMLLVESKCISAAFSKAKASGPWQFIGSTGKRYKLYSNQWRDDRRNLEMSTEAAIKYLRYLKQDLGDWFLAMAAYNAGEDRIRKLLKEQRITDYWKLHYVRETMRYVPRIIAAKEIYSQPEKYLGLAKKDLYAQLETETVAVTIKESQRHLASIAQDYGSYFLELKMLNPEISKEYLPKGTHSIRVPKQACPFRCLKQDMTP